MFEAQRFAELLKNTLIELKDRRNAHIQMLSTVDHEVNDIYHRIEQSKFNACNGYLLARELQMKLRERRRIKQELKNLKVLVDTVQERTLIPKIERAQSYIGHDVVNYETYTAEWT